MELSAADRGFRCGRVAPLPVTHSVQELLAAQISRLAERAALLLLLAAAESSGDLAQMLSAASVLGTGPGALAAAERAGLVAVRRGQAGVPSSADASSPYHGAPLAPRPGRTSPASRGAR